MSKPDQVEVEPLAEESGEPARLPRPRVRRVVADPEEIYPKAVVRRSRFSFDLIVSRYVLLSGAAVVALVMAVLLGEVLFRR